MSAYAVAIVTDSSFSAWLTTLEKRHLANLTPSQAARALRALSSCYVERRSKLAKGGALESAGKRAAFALFYGPLHFLVTREIVRAIEPARYVAQILDLGCGTGAAGAAWAFESGRCTINGLDRHPWAVAEANWTYRAFGITTAGAWHPGGLLGQRDFRRGARPAAATSRRGAPARRARPGHRAHCQAPRPMVGGMVRHLLCRWRPRRRVALSRRLAGAAAAARQVSGPRSARTDRAILVDVVFIGGGSPVEFG